MVSIQMFIHSMNTSMLMGEIADPYGAPAEVYEQTYHKIYDLVKKMKTTRD